MKKKVDFLFRYEHKARELESIMLLKIELERRGYSVGLICNYDYKTNIHYKPKVLIAPSVYTNAQLYDDWVSYGLIKKIANMQWEQLVGVFEEEDPNAFHNIKGIGQRIVNFCWGEECHDRLVRTGSDQFKSVIVGQVNTDMLRGPFKNTLMSKDILSKKYSIDSSKPWFFFISSFAFCEMDPSQTSLVKTSLGGDIFESFTEISYKSRDKILDWLETVVKSNPDVVVIYRPHPDETCKCVRLQALNEKYDNFYVISQESLKHWINASDKIYNWFSTGIVDAIVLNAPYRILRPYEIPSEIDVRLLKDANHISTTEEFLADLNNFSCTYGIVPCQFQKYFSITENFVYLKICDILEKLLQENAFDVNYTIQEYCILTLMICKSRASKIIKKIARHIPSIMLPIFIKRKILYDDEIIETFKRGYDKNVASEEEINEIYDRLRPIVYGIKI